MELCRVQENMKLDISEELIRRFDVSGPRYTSYPTADRFHPQFTEAHYRSCLAQRGSGLEEREKAALSLYIHIPFCASLCYYCACNKVITKHREQSATYLQYLDKELQLVLQNLPQREKISQLHLGGGTPTFLSLEEMRGLMNNLRTHFDFADDAEISIEIDPRTVQENSLHELAALGFNRASLGVQDFDTDVQKAVNRIQSFAMVENCMNGCREAGLGSVNFDLIYGLPKQNLGSFAKTLEQVISLSPARIALYNYAHLPTRFKSQRRIDAYELPSADQRLQIFLMSLRRLQEAGYVYIGLDHFSRSDDSLAQASLDHSLHRNFQGYTTRSECDLIALGVSAIGKIADAYVQNTRDLPAYYSALDAGNLPVEKGYHLQKDDVLRGELIMQLMCARDLIFSDFEEAYGIDFKTYFALEMRIMASYADAGLVELKEDRLVVTRKGRFFVRALSMVFDTFLQQKTEAQYSKLI